MVHALADAVGELAGYEQVLRGEQAVVALAVGVMDQERQQRYGFWSVGQQPDSAGKLAVREGYLGFFARNGMDQRDIQTRRYNAAVGQGLTKEASDIKTDLNYIESAIKARQTLVADDGFYADLGRVFEPRQPYERFAPWNLVNEYSMLEMEPPDHTRLRQLVAHEFTPRRVERLRDRVTAIADGLLDPVAEAGEADLITAVAEPLPVAVIAELLGVPEADQHRLRPWSNAIVYPLVNLNGVASAPQLSQRTASWPMPSSRVSGYSAPQPGQTGAQ